MKRLPNESVISMDRHHPQAATGLTLTRCRDNFLAACQLRNFSEHTLKSYQRGLNDFQQWCEDRGIDTPETLTSQHLNSYRRGVFHYRNKNGEALKQASQMTFLTPVRSLFRWLSDKQILLFNPASGLDMPRRQQTLPKHLLSCKEVEKIIAQVDVTEPLGLRDRALLELAYSTGIRRSELAALKVQDINLNSGWVLVEQGKGAKDRRIPIGERACLWLRKYVLDQRPYLVLDKKHHRLFVYKNGHPMSADKIYRVIHAFIASADLGKSGGSHLLRHAMATHMLEQGADVRIVQKMLGHEQLTSTQIYTRVQDNKLKEVHTKTHPAQLKAKMTGRDPFDA